MNEKVVFSELNRDILAGDFICEAGAKNWFDGKLPIYYCFFHDEYYEDCLYDVFGITFPESLGRSVVKRRAEHLAGRYCASQSLRRYGINTGNIGIGENRSPIWPPRILGSISHCDSWAIAVSAPEKQFSGIGVDIETVVSRETASRLRDSILTRDELPLLEGSYGSEEQLISMVFSVKESFFKAAYPRVGYYFDFDAVTILDIDWERGETIFRLNYTLGNIFTTGMLFRGMFRLVGLDKISTMVIVDH